MRVDELLRVAKVLSRLVDVLLEEILGERDRLGNVLFEQLFGVLELVVHFADRVVLAVVLAATLVVRLGRVTRRGGASVHRLALLTTTTTRAAVLCSLLPAQLSLPREVTHEEQDRLDGHVQRDQTQDKVEYELFVHEVVKEHCSVDAEQIRGHVAAQIVEL